MKKVNTLLLFLLVLIISNNSLTAQTYTSYQLPEPDDLSPLFVGSFTESAIYYGDIPSESTDKPVIVFVHGFIDLANLWFAPGNDMYDKAYDENYRTAFVATTRGEGMWTNGEIFAEMLEDITTHYGVSDVVIVAHSNGGKTSEVAMFQHDKKDLVNKVITLGTPFKGTGIANLAETPAFNWLVDFVGLGGGTATSTTYYMEGVARPILDNLSNNQPEKFINFGAWGYNNGTTITAPAMFVSGGLLNFMGGGPSTGGNDGVTPYYSSTRPGGSQQWPGHCYWWWCNQESKFDHIDITFDYVVWDVIEPYFSYDTNNYYISNSDDEIAQTNKVESNFELISTADGSLDAFEISKDAGQVSIHLMHEDEKSQFLVFDDAGKMLNVEQSTKKGAQGANSTLILENAVAGKYQIETDADDFAGLVAYEKGAILTYDNSKIAYQAGQVIDINVEFSGVKDADIKAVILQKNNLTGNPIENGETHIVNLEAKGNSQYTYTFPKGLSEGVYNVTIDAKSDDFRRSLVAGFVVEDAAQAIDKPVLPILTLSNYPNPVEQFTQISFNKVFEGTARLAIYDAYGRQIKSRDLSSMTLGNQTIEWDLKELSSGTFFLEFENGKEKAVTTLIKL